MQTEDLRWFLTLAEREHVTAAAEQLQIPQPTLSRALKRVEDAFGARLFEREPRGLRLNPLGRVVLDAARTSAQSLALAHEQIRQLTDPDAGLVRLAFLHSVSTSVLPELLGRFREHAPRVRFELRQEASPSILDDLRSGDADVAIIGSRPSDDGMGWCLLEPQRLRLACPPGHRLAGRRRLSLTDAAHERFIVVQPPLEFRGLTDRLCRAAGFDPEIAFESSDLGTIEGLVGAGLGVAVLPVYSGQRVDSPAVSVPLSDPGARRDIGLAWRTNVELSPAARTFQEYVVDSRRTAGAHAGRENSRSVR
ncbi:MAG TPA: LysR family transcriptional regulator [Nocardioidaceae bacterium]|nr:LysR family transcriptional regulator [Nocardioidaceae bacterium]